MGDSDNESDDEFERAYANMNTPGPEQAISLNFQMNQNLSAG